MSTTLPTWANNDLATYSAFTGLPASITQGTSSLPTKTVQVPVTQDDGNGNQVPVYPPKYTTQTVIDTTKLPKGVQQVTDENGNTTYSQSIATPSGWDPTVKLTANYDANGNLTGYSGSNPVFPAGANGKLSGSAKFDPSWTATGTPTSTLDTSKGGSPLTQDLLTMASFVPGAAPFIAALSAAQSIANGKINTGTILNTLTAATGLGGTLGLDPSTISDLNTAKQVASGVNAVQTKNPLALASTIANATGAGSLLPDGTSTVLNVLGGLTAASKGNLAGVLSAASNVASGSGNVSIPGGSSGTTNTPTQTTTPTSSTPSSGTGVQVLAPVVGKIVDYDIGGIKNPYTTNEQQSITMAAKGGLMGLPSLMRR